MTRQLPISPAPPVPLAPPTAPQTQQVEHYFALLCMAMTQLPPEEAADQALRRALVLLELAADAGVADLAEALSGGLVRGGATRGALRPEAQSAANGPPTVRSGTNSA